MFDPMSQFDVRGNNYRIVEAYGRPGRYHVNRNDWDDCSRSYLGSCRVLSDVSLQHAKAFVTEEITVRS